MTEKERKDSPEQAEYREYCRDWLSRNDPGPSPVRLPQSAIELTTTEQLEYLCSWQKMAYDGGLVGCDYPVEYGGGGRNDCQRIANEEMQKTGKPYFPNIIALGMAAPTLYHHASEELKRQFIPKIFSGEEIWCQGFSEPDAGSDLANVQTFVEKKGDSWVINGQKIWTSLAQFASWMIILCRHERSNKHGGLTYFVVPMKAAFGKGVDVRPLIKMTGEAGFNEVFFTNLEIPDSYRLDEVGNGWKVAMTTLLHERGAGPLVTPASGGRTSETANISSNAMALIGLAKKSFRMGKTAADDPVIRDRIMDCIIRQMGYAQSARRARVKGLMDHPMRIPQQGKLLMTELMQEISALGLEIEGAASTLFVADDHAPDAGQWPLGYLNSYGMTIAAGTSEVLRNILGERVLGMPKSK
ncbi:MAG: acyl-CoA dehydrogenase family protein [Proteobacteria bacterium]|nr:acyl-CoA dehydrogenase family protein [Pseudomonadota bacterium]MBU4471576.1 acyl-CoA dehydrogenase family protein [Pseudomonadota bacterium]MCG2752582.1 acyl-CoA dehydrogenase family protein [Desulfobacteraceae bacterium]